MKENNRRARAIAIAATEKHSREALLRVGYMTGIVLFFVGVAFSVFG